MKIEAGQILTNKLGNGEKITVRVINVGVAGDANLVRVARVEETRADEWLIKNNRTWAAPAANLEPQGGLVHKSGLVVLQ